MIFDSEWIPNLVLFLEMITQAYNLTIAEPHSRKRSKYIDLIWSMTNCELWIFKPDSLQTASSQAYKPQHGKPPGCDQQVAPSPAPQQRSEQDLQQSSRRQCIPSTACNVQAASSINATGCLNPTSRASANRRSV